MAEGKKEEKQLKLKVAKPSMPMAVRFAFFMLFVTAIMFLPTTILFFVCMIPTLVAAIVDNHARKTAWLTIGAMNGAGTLPIWINMMEEGHTLQAAFHQILDPSSVLVPYGGAAIGWIINSNVTPFVAMIVLKKNEKRVRDIEQRQQELIRKWGKGVVS